MSRQGWERFCWFLAIGVVGYGAWQIGNVMGIESSHEKKPLPVGGILEVWKDGKNLTERIGNRVRLQRTLHGIQVTGYRRHLENDGGSEPFNFLIPNSANGATLELREEDMSGIYGVPESPPAELPVPIKKPPVEFDPTPRFTVDPPEDIYVAGSGG